MKMKSPTNPDSTSTGRQAAKSMIKSESRLYPKKAVLAFTSYSEEPIFVADKFANAKG